MKTALAGFGGALVMLVVIAAWQARASASQASMAGWPQAYGVSAPAPVGAPGMMPVSYQSPAAYPSSYPQYAPGYAGSASNLVQLETARPVPVRYVSRDAAPRRVHYSERRHRNWAKTALVIGGSAGAGAGVGALAGGKKGALVGAALGGGVASLFEALKR